MKKIISIIISLLLLVSFACASAENSSLVLDLTSSAISQTDIENLNSLADGISRQFNCDVAVVVVDSTEGKDTQAFADDYYDYNDYGSGENDDGILLLIAVNDRKYAITTHGYGVWAFSDGDIDSLSDRFLGYLSKGDWTGAVKAFISGCEDVLYREEYRKQNNPNTYYKPAEMNPAVLIVINVAVGLIIGFIIVGGMKSKHKSVRKQTEAFDYLREGSFKLTHSNDVFINSQLTRVRRPEPQSRSSGFGGGGGSTHISSSGRSHGGKSGGF